MRTPWVSFDGKNCSGCKHLNERGYCEFTACIIPCTVSATIPEVKPRTNADRIRSMTDEELAEWLDNVCKSAYDEGYTKETDETLMSPYPSTASEWFAWLKQEAE